MSQTKSLSRLVTEVGTQSSCRVFLLVRLQGRRSGRATFADLSPYAVDQDQLEVVCVASVLGGGECGEK